MNDLETREYKLLRRQSTLFLSSVLITSFLIVSIGLFLLGSLAWLGQLLIVVGGSLLGVSLGLIFGGLTDASAVQRVVSLIEGSVSNPMATSDVHLEPLRRTWHFYFLTQRDGVKNWKYSVRDYAIYPVPGKLRTIPGNSGPYETVGYIVPPRLLLVHTPRNSTEPASIDIFAKACDQYRQVHIGYKLLENWDGNDQLGGSILSKKPFDVELGEDGWVLPEYNELLNKKWLQEAKKLGVDSILLGDT